MADALDEHAPSDSGEAAMEIFLNQWEIYQKYLRQNYLSNREACGVLRSYVADELGRPYRLLDLACGDASGIAAALHDTDIAHYRGIDLAPPAIAHAERHLEKLPCDVELEMADFVEAVCDNPQPIDIAWVSLSLHHFPTDVKLSVMRAVREHLAPDGALLIYEPTCRDGEDRAAWLERFEQVAKRDWSDLTPEEFAGSLDHVRTCDLPETVSDWVSLGHQAGFSSVEQRFQDPWDLFRIFCFRP